MGFTLVRQRESQSILLWMFVFRSSDRNLLRYSKHQPVRGAPEAALPKAIVEKAIQVGGTCTGEHGVGIGKRKFMQLEHGDSYQLMKQIKEVIDPKGLMNPGKIF
jgi:D-lactate dehydrogenase (cytochrome)